MNKWETQVAKANRERAAAKAYDERKVHDDVDERKAAMKGEL